MVLFFNASILYLMNRIWKSMFSLGKINVFFDLSVALEFKASHSIMYDIRARASTTEDSWCLARCFFWKSHRWSNQFRAAQVHSPKLFEHMETLIEIAQNIWNLEIPKEMWKLNGNYFTILEIPKENLKFLELSKYP